MKKIILFSLSVFFAVVTMQAQTLTLSSGDIVIGVNSTTGLEYTGTLILKNNASQAMAYKVNRKMFGTNPCAFDSAYFCWDLCYPATTDHSFGALTINPGSTSNAFSSYVYAKSDGSSCVDSIAYTFINATNVSDSLRIVIRYSSNNIFSIVENGKLISSSYPNPANTFFVVELKNKPTANAQIVLYNMVGSKVKEVAVSSNRVEINTNNLPNGVYLYSVVINGKAVDTKKVVVKH